MAQSIQTLGASATTSNVPLEEQLSILGMLQATMGGAEAGTKYKAFLRSAVKGGEALGLSFTDANNQLLSMPEILSRLQGKFGTTMDAAEKMKLQEAFGDTEAVALIDLMYNKTGDLQNNIVGMYDALGKGTGLTKEMASAINNTDPGKYEVLTQRIQNVKESIGDSLLPTIDNYISKGEQVLAKIDSWIGKNQELTKIIMILVLTLGGFLTVAGTTIAVVGSVGLILNNGLGFYRAMEGIPDLLTTIHLKALYAGDGLKKGFSTVRTVGASAATSIRRVSISVASMAKTAAISGATALKRMTLGLVGMARQAITTAVTALPGLIASVWSFTAALLANPITWIIIGIIALVAAIILLWRNWDSVTAWLKVAWDAACQGIAAGIQWIKDGFSGMIGWITGKIAWFGEAGKKIIDTLVGGIKSVAMHPVEAIKGIFQKVRNLLPFSDAKEGPLSTLTLSGQRTMTTYAQGVSLAQEAPADAVEKGLSRARTALAREPVKKVRFGSTESEKDINGNENGSSGSGKSVIIQKLLLQVDLKKIKDLQLLLKLLEEVEDYTNGSDSGYDPDAIPELA